MAQKSFTQKKPAWLPLLLDVVLCLTFALLGWVLYYTTGIESQEAASKAAIYKYVMVAAGLGMVALLWFGNLKHLRNLPSLLLIGYAAFSMLSVFWAVAGRLFIQRYSVVFTALFFFLYAVLRGRGDPRFTRRAMGICAGISTIYAFLGIEAVTTGLLVKAADKLFGEGVANMTFVRRLRGIFGNPNIESSFYALGIIFCAALICDAKEQRNRAFWAAALAVNVYAMMLGISLGAMACLVAAVAVYLFIAADKHGAVSARLLCGGACGIIFSLLASKLYVRSHALMLLLLVLCVAVAVLLELRCGEKLGAVIKARQKLVLRALLGAAALVTVYLVVGMQIGAPYTFKEGDSFLLRTMTLSSGEHTLETVADMDVSVRIYSKNEIQIITGGAEEVLSATAKRFSFSVPEDSSLCEIRLYGNPGETIYAATIDANKDLILAHRILPDIIANRLEGSLRTSGSITQRLTFVKDGFKLFCLRPIVGLGAGAFESMVTTVQDYEYETVHSHNQYIEALLEGGVIGFALFLGALITLGIALWKARKKLSGGEYAWLYPALCAEFVMSALQMLWDVSMSVTVFTCMIYTLYGMIVSTCAEPLALKRADAEQAPVKKGKAAAKPVSDTGLRVACSVLPLLFVGSVVLNIHAQRLIRQPVETLDGFMIQLSRAERIDLYEKNDIKLSYVRAQMENDKDGIYYAKANEYAHQLSDVQSNSIPYILVVYYLNTQQYELAIEEAKAGARFSPSDSKVWNNIIDAFGQMFIDSGAKSPLLNDDGALLRGLMEYYEALQERNAASLREISLNTSNQVFLDKLIQLNACNGDKEAMYAILVPSGG